MSFSNTTKVIGGCSGIIITSYAVGVYAEHNYPANQQTKEYHPGEKYPSEGKPKFVIGYTGHHIETLSNIDKTRPLYFGSKKVAQGYAKRNGGENGAVGMIIGNQFPHFKHFGPARTAMNPGTMVLFYPLSPEGMKELNIDIVCIEKVTEHNELGKIPAIRRMGESIFNEYNNKRW